MGVDVVALRELHLGERPQQLLDQLGAASAHLVGGLGGEGLVPPDDRPRESGWQQAAQDVGDRVAGRQGGDVAGRALEHRDVRGGLGHGGRQGDRGGAAADHHHLLAGVVEVGRPVLGVDDRPAEAVSAGEVGLVAVVVAVVAAAGEQEPAGELHRLSGVGAFGGDVPAGFVARPVGGHDAVVEADVAIDALLRGGVLYVPQDRVTVGDGLGTVPGPKGVAEGEHVRVRPDARVAEQVPGAADGVAGFEDGVAGPRTVGLDVVTGADARQSCADDQHVEVLGHDGLRPPWWRACR